MNVYMYIYIYMHINNVFRLVRKNDDRRKEEMMEHFTLMRRIEQNSGKHIFHK